ncbi:VOC family protein [Cryobacterium melibiosiphilum]|uniref:VOC family protein n=2 Tax=Cryobacterium melibiosiphilum TaxID=995039 RepID=A0A3A5MA42_9MICO|nr:VOC family protein [Cryobacterium melibiosiphilum]
MIPLLPCASIDDMQSFFELFGFETTHRQTKPNPYICFRREGIDLHYFGLPQFRAADSYGSCVILVDDTEPLFEVFAAGLRSRFGKLPQTGFPRITRPRRRANAGNLSGFSLVDPSGNWIRVMAAPASGDVTAAADAAASAAALSPLARALANAIVLADSKGDVPQATKILRGALARAAADTPEADRAAAAEFLTELDERAEPEAPVAEL